MIDSLTVNRDQIIEDVDGALLRATADLEMLADQLARPAPISRSTAQRIAGGLRKIVKRIDIAAELLEQIE